jgi:hypothetical protein
MVYTQSYQIYKYEHGLSAAEQGAADVRAGEAAAAVRDLWLGIRRTFRAIAIGSRNALHDDPRGRPGPRLGVGRRGPILMRRLDRGDDSRRD